MTPGEEHEIYETDRSAWIQQAAPRLAKRMQDMNDEQINHAWDVAGEDYKRAVWALLNESQKTRLRVIRSAA